MSRFALTKTTPLLLGMLALAACPGDETPIDTEGTSTGEETTSMGPTTAPMTTTIDPDSGSGSDDASSSSSSGGDVCDGVMCPDGQECIGGSCFDCGAPTCDGGCPDGQSCQCPPDDQCCDVGSCSEPVCPLPPLDGNYADCLDDMGVASDAPCEGAGCVTDTDMNPTAGVCVASGCDNVCQCPAAPDTGDAPVNCEDVTGDMVADCWLACDAGQTCPDGMSCFGGFICLFSNNAPVDVPLFGDCVNVPGATCTDGFCVTAPDGGVCTAPCADAGECVPAPATGDAVVTCSDVTGDMMDECWLSCEMDETCPDGMECFGGFVCIWPEVVPPPPPTDGFGPCIVPGTDCAAGEVCLDDAMGMMDPTYEVCAQEGCVAAGDCTLTPPATGDAPVACGDPTGSGADTCYLDCSGGQTCPDGMACSDGTVCAWPNVAALFEDDFETGDLSAGWTLADVDGLTPNAMVAFVDAAWVALDDGSGANTVAMSTSWYMPAGVSDDWLISPQIDLGPSSWLFFASVTIDPAFPDNLEVFVSTTGNTPADFTDAAVYTAMPEGTAFMGHAIDLAALNYANESVYIAFRNSTNDGYLLFVDNVSVVELP